MAKKAAYGTALTMQRLQTGTYVALTNLNDITGPEVSVEPIDVTTHDSADGFGESIPGLADGGEVSFEMQFDPSSVAHETLYADVAARQMHNWRLQLPGFASTTAGGYVQFAGFLTKVGMGLPVKGSITAPISIKVSGKPTYFKFV